MKKRAIVWAICGLGVVAMAGCNNDNARDLSANRTAWRSIFLACRRSATNTGRALQQTQAATSDTDKKLPEPRG